MTSCRPAATCTRAARTSGSPLKAWLATEPYRNEENQQKYMDVSGKSQELEQIRNATLRGGASLANSGVTPGSGWQGASLDSAAPLFREDEVLAKRPIQRSEMRALGGLLVKGQAIAGNANEQLDFFIGT
jgi:hypothetical protein